MFSFFFANRRLILIKALFLSIVLLVATLGHTEINIDKDVRTVLCKKTASYFHGEVNYRWTYYNKSMYAASRTARMFPMYPAKNNMDRTLQFFELGCLESFWTPNLVVANVPGIHYSIGSIKHFSVDYSRWGLNEEGIEWTYAVAKAIQDNKKIPTKIGNWYATPEFIKLMKKAYIPKNLKLKQIDLNIASDAHSGYILMHRKGYSPKYIKKHLKLGKYIEEDQDDIDSALIYRVIEEVDRYTRGWKYGLSLYTAKKEHLYTYLSKFTEAHYGNQ